MGVAGHRENAKKKKAVRVVKVKPMKKQKKAKPKHLNRKLGSATNEEERRRILFKIQELETSKNRESSPDSKPSEPGGQSATPVPAGSKTASSDHAGVLAPANQTDDDKQIPVIDTPRPSKEQVKAQGRAEIKDEKDSTHRSDDPQDAGDDMKNHPENSKRQRGKRRRGRQDTSSLVVEQEKVQETKLDNQEVEDDKASVVNAKRYCVGRKPVTDFEVGKSYSGKIIYSKPFGVFIDIGCHSDAFCHVSRLRDDFVEDVEQWRAEHGDTVDTARVVEIDRQRKRITVSLQSEARLEDETMSVKAREERRRKLLKKRSGQPKSSRQESSSSEPIDCSVPVKQKVLPAESRHRPKSVQDTTHESNGHRKVNPDSTVAVADAKAKVTEEKRQRKLARRAARRGLKETDEQHQTGANEDE